MNKLDFSKYYTHDAPPRGWSGRCSAYYSGVPIALLNEFRTLYPGQFRIRYRGPRNTPLDLDRSSLSRQSTCLKQNARTFTAYQY